MQPIILGKKINFHWGSEDSIAREFVTMDTAPLHGTVQTPDKEKKFLFFL